MLARLQAMRDVFRTVAALRSALSAHSDLLLESLALRHQLGVLARSDRRFRPSDRLLSVCLRRRWPRWREALVLVQPDTVARWHREGFSRCWSRRFRNVRNYNTQTGAHRWFQGSNSREAERGTNAKYPLWNSMRRSP